MSDVLFYGCQDRNQALVVSPGRSSTIFYHLHITRYQFPEQVSGAPACGAPLRWHGEPLGLPVLRRIGQ